MSFVEPKDVALSIAKKFNLLHGDKDKDKKVIASIVRRMQRLHKWYDDKNYDPRIHWMDR